MVTGKVHESIITMAGRNPFCINKCKGKCIGKTRVEQQENFRNEFPNTIMPNDCVFSSDGRNLCPYK